MNEECVLYDRICTDCGECDTCDLDDSKICDNCGKCLDEAEDYRTLNIEEFIEIQDEKEMIEEGESE